MIIKILLRVNYYELSIAIIVLFFFKFFISECQLNNGRLITDVGVLLVNVVGPVPMSGRKTDDGHHTSPVEFSRTISDV